MSLLSEAQLADLHAIFVLHDVERKGRISIAAAQHLATVLGYDPHDKDAPGFNDAFTSINGVSWEQFHGWVGQLTLQPMHPRFKRDFQLLDRLGTKSISESDLQVFFQHGTEVRLKPKSFSKELVEMYDRNGTGTLDYHDFVRFLKENTAKAR